MHTTFKAANSASEPHFFVPPKFSDAHFLPQLRCVSTACADCPVEQCGLRDQHTDSSVIYLSAPKRRVPTLAMPVPTNPTTENVLLSQPRQFGTHDNGPSEMCFSQLTNAAHTGMYPPLDESTAS